MTDDERRFRSVIETVERLIRDPVAPEALVAHPRDWLERSGLVGGDLDEMARMEPRRLLIYRRLVRRGLASAIKVEIPRTAARLGAAFDAWTTRWLDEELPRSHYLRDVAFEFLEWVTPRWAVDGEVPAYLADLGRHELCAFEVAAAPPSHCATTLAELELDRRVVFDASVRLMRYSHAVHRLSADEAARDVPSAEPTQLLAYRDAEQEVRYLELTPRAATILERLMAGETLRRAVLGSLVMGQALDQPLLEGTAQLLANLGERGVLRGAECS